MNKKYSTDYRYNIPNEGFYEFTTWYNNNFDYMSLYNNVMRSFNITPELFKPEKLFIKQNIPNFNFI